MYKSQWTLLRWCGKTHSYVERWINDSLAPLAPRNTRLPSIDKLAFVPPDPRVIEFRSRLRDSSDAAGRLLNRWAPSLDHNTLEEFALVLASKSGGTGALSEGVKTRLTRIGTLENIESALSKASLRHQPSPGASAKSSPSDMSSLPFIGAGQPKQKRDSIQNGWSDIPSLQNLWFEQLQASRLQAGPDPLLAAHVPFVKQCEIVSAELAILTSQIATVPFPQSLSRVCRKLGDVLEHALLSSVAKDEGMPYWHRRSRYLWGVLGQAKWTTKQRIIVGAWWIEQALALCRFGMLHKGRITSRPAFWRTWYMKGPTKRGVFVLNPSLLKQLKEDSSSLVTFVKGIQLPTLSKPRPWTALYANIDTSSPEGLSLIASQGHSLEGQTALAAAIASGRMQLHLDGLNRLAGQSWQINHAVLGVLRRIDPSEMFDEKEVEHGRKVSGARWTHALAIAEALGARQFYLPMYLDFRGRSYASSMSVLNFMGQDPVRALFQFGTAKPLGGVGLHWLEVHAANLYGKCKGFDEQRKRDWIEANRGNIANSVRDLLQSKWWCTASKPFQFLAACFELSGAWNSEDPAKFMSSLPIQLDGTCNGLQHLVSLSGDVENAPHVNIKSGAGCGDVYSTIARLTSKEGAAVERDLVKDAVMTFFYGASLQHTTESLKSRGAHDSARMARQIRESLDSMFLVEREVQSWLVECARRITNSVRADQPAHTTAVAWTSPLGMPVVQPYVEPKLMAVRTPLQSFFMRSQFHQAPIVREKQLAGVVANFIHSLDAAHMLATCRALPPDVSFSAVHDSFWTHASDVPLLGRVIREQFAQLHTPDLLSRLREEWTERYRGFVVLGRVHSDSALYEKVLWSRDGAQTKSKQDAFLERELQDWYNGKSVLVPESGVVRWHQGVPCVGTPGQPWVKAWLPLEISAPPQRGTLNVADVMESRFFFS